MKCVKGADKMANLRAIKEVCVSIFKVKTGEQHDGRNAFRSL